MKLNLKMRKRNRKTRKQQGGGDDENTEVSFNRDVAHFLTSTRCAEVVNLLSQFNMSEKDWGQLKHNLISLSGEKKIEDVPFTGTMKELAEKVNATEEKINSASDELETKPNWDDENVNDPVDVFCQQLGFEDDLTNRDDLDTNPDEDDEEEEEEDEESNVEESKENEDGEEESNVEESNEKPKVEELVDVNNTNVGKEVVKQTPTGGKRSKSRKRSQKKKSKTFKRRKNKN